MNGLKTDTIINRDALYALRELPEESVHCCVTSPPYYALRDYGLDMQIGREDTPALPLSAAKRRTSYRTCRAGMKECSS